MDVLETNLRGREGPVRGWVQAGQAELHLAKSERFFTPVLHLDLAQEEGRRVLVGRFGPLPQVWILFMGIYFLLGIAGTAGLMYGASQWMLGREPWALLGAPVAVALAAFTYGAAFIGQGLSAEQMYELRCWVERSLENAGIPPKH